LIDDDSVARAHEAEFEKEKLDYIGDMKIWDAFFSLARRLPGKPKILVIIPGEPNQFRGSAASADDVLEKVHLLFPFTFHLSAGDVIDQTVVSTLCDTAATCPVCICKPPETHSTHWLRRQTS
jgi:hypothetical protein